MFARLGTWCHRRRRTVVALWLVALFALGGLSSAVGADFRQEMSLPNSDSQAGIVVLEEHFGGLGAGMQANLVFRAEQGVHDPEVQAAMEAFLAQVEAMEHITLQSPYAPGGEIQVAFLGDEAGKIAFARLDIPDDVNWTEGAAMGKEILALTPDIDGLQVELGSEFFVEFKEPKSEIIGLAFAIVILIVAFGSVLGMSLPIGVALAGISVGTTLLILSTRFLSVPDFTQFLGIMIGLGVGIDYALFIVTRFRENVRHGHSQEEATAIAVDTAGRAVAFAGATVVISFLGMTIIGMAFVTGLAVAAALVVATTVVASITLLPALLGFAGERLEVTHWRGLIAAGLIAAGLLSFGLGLPAAVMLVLAVAGLLVLLAGTGVPALRQEVPHRPPKPVRETLAYRWSRFIQRRPWTTAISASVLLLVLSLPVLGLRLGFADEGNFAPETSARKAYDLLAAGFGPGFNGPLFLAAELPPGADPAALGAVTEAINADPGVFFAPPPQLDDPAAPAAALWFVIPATAPQDEATTQLVKRLRTDTLVEVEADLGTEIFVSGFTAGGVDFSDYLAQRLPFFLGAVLLLSFLLLMAVFRSLLVPLKAVVMNLLSIGAAYGVIVAVFQWGWFSSLTGVQPAPIEPFVPMMLFAIVFGLSMDYEVFLLSRVKEEWHRTGDSHLSVANGLAVTAKVITAAAAIMVVVFGSFLFEPDRLFKMFGLGLALAVFLDATVVRLLLVPATMELLGDKNWWLPGWLDRILPRIDVEGTPDDVDDFGDDAGPADDVPPAVPDTELAPA